MESRVSMGTSVQRASATGQAPFPCRLQTSSILFWRKRARSRALVHGVHAPSVSHDRPPGPSMATAACMISTIEVESARRSTRQNTTSEIGRQYDRALVKRGDYHRVVGPGCRSPLWETVLASAQRGVAPRQYSDLAIETARDAPAHLPPASLRQTEGFLTSIFGMLGRRADPRPITPRSPGVASISTSRLRARPRRCRPAISCFDSRTRQDSLLRGRG